MATRRRGRNRRGTQLTEARHGGPRRSDARAGASLGWGDGPLFEPLIPRVLADLAGMNPGVLVPAHCTGWRAQHAMSARFPDAFVPNTVGASFYL